MQYSKETKTLKANLLPWLGWLSGLSTRLGTKGSPVGFPVRTHAWVAGQVPSGECKRGNHTLMFLSFSFSFPSPLSKNNKYNLKKNELQYPSHPMNSELMLPINRGHCRKEVQSTLKEDNRNEPK